MQLKFLVIAFSGLIGLCSVKAETLEQAIATIQNVGPEGKGNTEAATAWQTLIAQDARAIIPLLHSMSESGPLSRNWLRSAIEVIFERTSTENPVKLPMDQIQDFLLETDNDPGVRKLSFDLIKSIDPKTASDLESQFLNDPSPELRLSGVKLFISKAKNQLDSGQTSDAIESLQTALNSARDVDQIKEISKLLREKADQSLDLPSHFGFLMYWQMVGPFDNTGRSGFHQAFAPETTPDNNTDNYQGKTKEVGWTAYQTTDEYGMVNFNDQYTPLKEVTGYALTEFNSAEETQAELRLGCKNAWKIWLNGEYVFGRDEYHRGMRIDQYTLPVTLKKGVNTILIKVCQDEQEKDWTKEWQFQLRVCDSTGTAIHSTDRKPTPQKQQTRKRPTRP